MPKRLLCISTNWPEADATAAGIRLLSLLDCFLSAGYEVHMCATSSHLPPRKLLEPLGICTHQVTLNDPNFNSFLKNIGPTTVLFDRYLSEEQFGWRVRACLPKALIILDTEDLHSLRFAREEALKKKTTFSITAWKALEITKREMASIYRSDLTLVVSKFEYNALKNNFSVSEEVLFLMPITYRTETIAGFTTLDLFKNRAGYMFIGNGKHPPNVDAIKWLHHKIWPLIRAAQPKANVSIYGAYLPQQIRELHHSKAGFLIKGHAPSVGLVMRKHRINLVPLRFGAGIKGKILDGFLHGIPHITTPIGAEGMEYQKEWPGVICNTAKVFASQAVALYCNMNQWQDLQIKGKTYVNRYFNTAFYAEPFLYKLAQIRLNLSAHRANNFIGAMLEQQGFQASKYLSLWITEKNKNH